MAKGGKDEHKMLFDMQGRRRNVVKVVYAILAVLMGLSLLLVIGPAPISDLLGLQDEAANASKQYEEQAKRIEVKLAKDPEDPALLVGLTRARINAGNQLSEQNTQTGEVALSPEGRQQLEQASATWSDYLEATDEPSANLALLMANSLFLIAQNTPPGPEFSANIEAAAEAQKIFADQRPSINSLLTYSLYTLYTFDFPEAKKAKEEAEAQATSKSQRAQIDEQYKAIAQRARQFEAETKERERLEEQLPNQGGGGEGSGSPLENPFGGNSLTE